MIPTLTSAVRTAARYVGLIGFFGGVGLHRLTEYRLDFILGVGSFAIRVGAQITVLSIVFAQVPTVGGWGYHQVLFLYGFSLLPRGLDHLFTDQLWELGRKLVQTGEFHRYLIRPVGPMFALLSERFLYPDGFGELLLGLALSGYSAYHLGLRPSVPDLLLASLFVGCGALIYAGVKLLFACAAFWTTTSLPAMSAVYQASDFAAYPLELYRPSIRRLLTWALPFAFTSYIPATYFLFGDTRLVALTPVVAGCVLLVAAGAWRLGLKRYEMSGS
jgi:ABC-2 type transport system permease protein